VATDAQLALQAALVAALDGHVGAPVFDYVPQDQAYPYVTIGDSTAVDFDTKTEVGQDHTVTIHTWTRAKGRESCKIVMGAIFGLLHRGALTVTGHAVIDSRVVYADVLQDPNETGHPSGPVWHGVQRVRIITQSN